VYDLETSRKNRSSPHWAASQKKKKKKKKEKKKKKNPIGPGLGGVAQSLAIKQQAEHPRQNKKYYITTTMYKPITGTITTLLHLYILTLILVVTTIRTSTVPLQHAQ
jgi:hypothetical protein